MLDKGKRPREKSPDFELENLAYKKQRIQSSEEIHDGAGPSHLNYQETSETNQDLEKIFELRDSDSEEDINSDVASDDLAGKSL